MLSFRDYSVKKKLTVVVMLASGAALLLVCTMFFAYDVVTFRAAMVRRLSTEAAIIGLNSASALLFHDQASAEQTLAALQALPQVESAGIFASQGGLFATYRRQGVHGPALPAHPPASSTDTAQFRGGRLVIFHPVVLDGERIGDIYIRADLTELDQRLASYGALVTLALAVAFLATLLIAARLQPLFTGPILQLVETARAVSEKKDYSVRARASGRDELGVLVGAFNEMLARIQEQNSALEESHLKLERRVEERTADLQREVEERRQAQTELDRFFTLSLDLLCIADFQGRFQRLNPAWEKTLGYKTEELLARPYLDFVHPDDREATRVVAERVAAGAEIISFENRYMCRDGSYRWLLWKSVPVLEAGLIYAAARDITERKQTEEKLREMNQELEAFTYSVSHDLRAPLRHAAGFARILLEESSSDLNGSMRRHLERINRATLHMGQLIEDLLTLSRVSRQELDQKPVALGPLVEGCRKELRSAAVGRRIDWRVEALPTVRCDRGLVRQVLINLLSNAVKYTRPRDPAVIEVGATEQDGHKVIYVRDNGVGFDMKYAGKLFGAFQRLHRAEEFEGTGVGLATVQRIIRKHGGRVWVESEVDRGTSFYFTLEPGGTGIEEAKHG